jgi:hypothetical protein
MLRATKNKTQLANSRKLLLGRIISLRRSPLRTCSINIHNKQLTSGQQVWLSRVNLTLAICITASGAQKTRNTSKYTWVVTLCLMRNTVTTIHGFTFRSRASKAMKTTRLVWGIWGFRASCTRWDSGLSTEFCLTVKSGGGVLGLLDGS